MMLVMIVLSVFTLGIVAEVEATDTTAVAAETAADTTVDTSAETDTAAATDDSGSDNMFIGTFWSLIPPVVAIVLALITKEVYSSLFIGILVGGLFAAQFSPLKTVDAIINDGLIAAVSGSAGIFIFLVILGMLVALINKTGAAAAFGKRFFGAGSGTGPLFELWGN